VKIILEHELPEHQAEELFSLLTQIKDLLLDLNEARETPEEGEDQEKELS
tara:strand:+ start:417 stop:566 length:150 start_codon:yes stop_codon:yes gene_type:complete